MSTRARSRNRTAGSISSSVDFLHQRNDEEIIMTPLKAKVGQIIRVERVPSGAMDNKKVHYLAEGPYKGIVVNRATNVRPYKSGPETVRRFIAYVQDDGLESKEIREIRFWFKPDTDSGSMEDYSAEFFRELISPKNFPKGHLQFVKRVLTLVQKYDMLKFVELEMRPYTSKDDPIDARGQTRHSSDYRPKLRKAISAVDQDHHHHPVRQAASTDDLQAPHRRRKVRRLTVGGIEQTRPGENAVPTVFVYNSPDVTDGVDPRKKGAQGLPGAQQQLLRSEALENLNDIRTDDSVFSYNGDTPNNVRPSSEAKVRRGTGPPPTGAQGNPSYITKESNNEFPSPIYGVVKKNRKSTEATPPAPGPETVLLTRSPKGPSRSSHRTTENQSVTSPPPVEKRRSSRRPKSSASLTSPGANVLSSPIRDSYTGSDVFDASSSPQKEVMVNGKRSSSSSSRKKNRSDSVKSSFRDSKVNALLEDAFPTMLSTDDLVRMTRLTADEVDNELGKLNTAGMAMEVESGYWVRSQVVKRLKSSSRNDHTSGQDTDLHRNEFRMVASAPSLAPEDQPTIAIITSLYCEKLAIDAMMDVKKTYVRYKTKGEGLVYTVGLIDRHRIVSTKLSKVGHGSETKLSAENTIPRLLETFGQIEHVLLVGVGGGVANYDDDSEHVRLGDVVVSKTTDRTNQFLYYHVTGSDGSQSSSITLETRPWSSPDSELRSVVSKMQRSPKKLWRQMDAFLVEASEELESAGQLDFIRPPPETDQLYRVSTKTRVPASHPEVTTGSARGQRPNQPLVHFGGVATGKILTRDDGVRGQFCLQQKVKAVDSGFQKVLASLENQSGLSFTLVRGVADYSDGTKMKQWHWYSALAAAAVTKCLVMRLSLPGDADGVV